MLIETRGIEKHYDGVHALRGVNVSVERGEVHALIGENGAGKSTLGKIIAGVVKADGGEIWLDEKRVHIDSPLDAQKLGIGIIFQELDLFSHLSVGENIVIRNLKTRESPIVRFAQVERFCAPFLRHVGLDVRVDTPLRELSIGQMQLVAIARALSMDAALIVMDEPT